MALLHTVGQVVERAHAARGDHRHPHRIGHAAGERQVKPGFGAVAVHAGEQNFASAELGHLPCPGHRIQPGVLATAVAVNIPAFAARQHVVTEAALGVDGDHNALRAVFV